MRDGRVLVVDDEPAIRALVAKVVERAGYGVDSARDGAEAIEKINSTTYTVLVIDLMMPQVSGYELVDYIARQPAPRPAVIVITADDSPAVRQLNGAVVHSLVRKPFDIETLGDLITAAAKVIYAERTIEAPASTPTAVDDDDDLDARVVRFPRT
jgi:CheY-like chemotaxis protein